MAFGQPEDPAGDFFGQVLGGMMNFLGTSFTPQSPVDIAKSIALGIATGGKAESNVDPSTRMEIERVCRVAELYLADSPLADHAGWADLIEPAGRGAWAVQTVVDWSYLLQEPEPGEPGRSTGSPQVPGTTSIRGEEAGRTPRDGTATSHDPATAADKPDTDTAADAPGKPNGDNLTTSLTPEEESILSRLESSLAASGYSHPIPGPAAETSPMAGYGADEHGNLANPASMASAWMKVIGPAISAMQLGTSIGYLAQQELGQYGLLVPRRDTSKIMVVPENITIFSKDWSLKKEEVWLWIALREMLAHKILSLPHIGGRMRSLLAQINAQITQASFNAMQHFGDMFASGNMENIEDFEGFGAMEGFGGLQNIEHLISDPASLLDDAGREAHASIEAEIRAINALLVGYLDYVMKIATDRLLGGKSTITEAWHRYQVGQSSQQMITMVMGIGPDPENEERGKQFISGILQRDSGKVLDILWQSESTLPTVAELDAPGLWLERLKIEGLI
ncbi:MAG: zinc-dependent metalloprotease [Actinobacteria bacterium]|nr:zinc-dependent metalloprotease [Actinomycetota bacterium]MCL5446769.1 zinc-dependent metalloprotease [Actinomycetota bacterium]